MLLVQSPLTALAPRALAPRALARSPAMLSRGVTRRAALLNVLGLSPAAAGASGPPDAPDADNIFGRILRGEAPAEIVDGDDPELFTFVDKRPASTVHLLVIPRRFIRDASTLAPEDLPLVGRMEAKARALVQRTVGADAFDERELALGFHWPPWYSVPWLHLHAIYPKSAMSRRWKYTAVSFYSPDRVREIIGRR